MIHITFNTWCILLWAIAYLVADYYQHTIRYGVISKLFKQVSIILFLTVMVVFLAVGGELELLSAWDAPFVNITTLPAK